MTNYRLKTTNIKGREYVEVNERVIAFRKLSEFKGFSLETELVSLDSETCVVKAIIRNADGQVISTGLAQEDKSSSHINKTSYVENCETSAVGRALGFLGIGVETSIATADEVSMAIAKQDKLGTTNNDSDVFSKAVDYIKSAKDKPKAHEAVLAKYGEQFSDKQKQALQKFV